MDKTTNTIDVQSKLSGIDYPANKQRLIEKAQENGADTAVLDVLDQLPEMQYQSATQVSEQLNKLNTDTGVSDEDMDDEDVKDDTDETGGA